MAHKPQTKTAASNPKLSNTTVAFLNTQNQDLCTKSIMQTSLLVTLPKLAQVQVQCELDAISFTYEAPTLPLPPLEAPKEEEDFNDNEMDIHLFNNALASLILWCRKDSFNKETDSDAQDTLIKHIFKVAKDFNLVTIITPPTPSPPPPCTQPHSDEEDIHMEPPTPTCVFSEAATQTPAPLSMLTMPTPPPLLMTSAPAASKSSKPRPTPRPSFAEAVAKTLHPTAPHLCKAHHMPHSPPLRPPKVLSQASTRNGLTLQLKDPLDANSISKHQQLLVGIMCTTATVPNQSDLEIIKATLPPKISGSQVLLPMLQSFIKIVDIPYFIPGTMVPPNGQEISNQLILSPILVDKIEHVWFVCNSPKANSGTFWIDLVDTQQGTLASSLISQQCFLSSIN
ncbi:hypothetical protein P691DRAFT_830812, partial [Macrolepiota fuliginosa MF-IS2]